MSSQELQRGRRIEDQAAGWGIDSLEARPLRSALGADKAIGKQLGFLAQEIGREVNTIGSKANDADIATWVIAMKGELEKFREQVENLE